MAYYNYHATAKRMIGEGKLIGYYFTEKHNNISPALVLVFNDCKHGVMPIREYRWGEYLSLLDENLMIEEPN
ncbi:MAG: thermostable hemolysin delta-VPH [Clostridiales bacterium]|nr:thermostable hemolysin delta-VPH [Clostridiales bacterium]